MSIIDKSKNKYRDDGFISLTEASIKNVLRRSEAQIRHLRYRMRFGDVSPRPYETVQVDPSDLEFTIPKRAIPHGAPIFGILSGDWDTQKSEWRESIWYGLLERFEKGLPWQETVYYKNGIKKLEQNRKLKRAEGATTVEEFEEYLDEIDCLYESIKKDGYHRDSIITADIGRNGEWMTSHGNHRRTIAVILGVETVPVRIRYRHQEWQKKRVDIYNNTDPKKFDLEEDHPDLNNW